MSFPLTAADPDGSIGLLTPLDGRPESYHRWAEAYYERDVNVDAVKAVYDHQSLTADMIQSLNREITLVTLEADITEIGYSTARP